MKYDLLPFTGLREYDAMVNAIERCVKFDEVRQIRAKARAFEVYAKQARNFRAEKMAIEIRIRAERRSGEILKELKEEGLRHSGIFAPGSREMGKAIPRKPSATSRENPQKSPESMDSPRARPQNTTVSSDMNMSRNTTESHEATPLQNTTLSDLRITKDESSKWQQLANIPEDTFESALGKDDPQFKPSTKGVLAAAAGKKNEPVDRLKRHSGEVFLCLRELKKHLYDPGDLLFRKMDVHQQLFAETYLPRMCRWLNAMLEESTRPKLKVMGD